MTSMIFKNESFDSFGVTIPIIFHESYFIFVFTYNLTMLIKSIKLYYTHSMCAIDFLSNNISGSISIELFTFTAVQSLNLYYNQLMGMFPQDIENLVLLESLIFSSNF
ncbi:hypothetical protein AHAS_Ahas20G0261700 [Arachis hypogaea]